MVSMTSGGAAARIAARTFFRVVRAGSGTCARYSLTVFAAPLRLPEEPRPADFALFMPAPLDLVTPTPQRGLCGQVEGRIPGYTGTLPAAPHAEVKHEAEKERKTNRRSGKR